MGKNLVVESKICLGTVKVGLPLYGYSQSNNVDDHNALFLKALEIGVNCFDTSPRYGNSEKIIGKFIDKHKKKIFISTKVDNLNIDNDFVYDDIIGSVLRSKKYLGVDCIDLCYLHQNELNIISNKFILNGLNKLKNEGLVKMVGASVYSKSELDFVLKSDVFDWVQIPVNILDTSFYNYILNSNSNIKIAARSIFLQGIMFDSTSMKKRIPDYLTIIKFLKNIEYIGKKYNMTLSEIAVAYISSLKHINKIIVGTSSIENLIRMEKSSRIILNAEIKDTIDRISSTSKTWTNPRMWNLNG